MPSLGTVCPVNPLQFLEASARLIAVIRGLTESSTNSRDGDREMEGGRRVRGTEGGREVGESVLCPASLSFYSFSCVHTKNSAVFSNEGKKLLFQKEVLVVTTSSNNTQFFFVSSI